MTRTTVNKPDPAPAAKAKPAAPAAKAKPAALAAKTRPAAAAKAKPAAPAAKALTTGQQAYEAKRAAKAGMSVDRWLASKQRAQENEAREKARAAEPAKPAKPPGLLARLLERAHKPLR